MKSIDEPRLETDLAYRYEYLAEFIGFTAEDVALIHGLAAKLSPRIGAIVETTYVRMLAYTATARHFLPRQFGFEGALPPDLAALHQDTEQIRFRKEHLRRYLLSLLGNPYDARMVRYLDVVGKMHTPRAGNRQIDVPLVQMNALMGLLSDALAGAIMALELDRRQEQASLRAIQKLLWIQNDLISRHYAGGPQEPPPAPPPASPAAAWR